MAKTITVTNSIFMLSIADLYPTPQKMEGYASDKMFAFEDNSQVETVMGVDGNFHAGFIQSSVKQTISLMPDSPSAEMMMNWAQTQRATREVMKASATIILPAINKKYTLTDGYLTSSPLIPTATTTLQPLDFVIEWGQVAWENV